MEIKDLLLKTIELNIIVLLHWTTDESKDKISSNQYWQILGSIRLLRDSGVITQEECILLERKADMALFGMLQ